MDHVRILTAALMLILFAGLARADERVIWQIGKFDNNYEEFAVAHDYSSYWAAFRQHKTFTVGKDDPAKSWPFIHPGPSDSWAKNREQPHTILFDLDAPPAGVFTLTIDLVDTHAGGPPVYEITINGRTGRFALPAGAGDGSLADASKGKEYVLTVPLPATFLKAGQNKLILKCTEGSWVLYDALKLTNDPEGKMPEPAINRVSLIPTILFVADGSKLKQVIELSAEVSPGSPDCAATLKIGGATQSIALTPGLMGTAQQEVHIDEITAPTTAEITVTCGSQSKSASCELRPQKRWKIYLQPSSHVDVGYTDFQERVVERHNENMSVALDMIREHPDFKWNTETAWVEDNYLSMMPEDKKAEFIKRAKEGRVGCQAVYGNMLTGICSHESFIRDLYFARAMAKKYGIPYDIAMSSDVPTQVWTLPTVLAGAGIKYFSDGLNLTRGDSFNRLFGKSPFYWQGPDGAKVLTWLSPGYAHAAHLGLLGTVDGAENRVEGFLRGYDRADYPYDAVLAFGGIGDNQLLNPVMAQVIDDWNKKYAYPKIIPCRGPEFFQYVESKFRDKIPTLSGDAGVYWEDGAGSSAYETALVRRAKEDLAGAEKLWSLMSAASGAAYPKAEFDLAWKNAILYDEHTWGAHCSISQPENEQTLHQWKIKARFAYDAASQADALVRGALDQLAKSVKCGQDSVVVFNPLSFPYTGPVTAKDKSGRSVLVWAKDVPPTGCKVVPIAKLDVTADLGQGLSANFTAGETPVLQNRFYRLEFDKATGAVKSLRDKELNLELVDPKAAHGINEYIYVAGQGATAKEVTRDAATPPATTSGSIDYIADGKSSRPYRYVMEVKTSGYKTPQVVSRVILYEDTKRIDFENVLTKDETYDKEAGYFAFPFGLTNPELYVELPDGVVRPKKEMLPGACMQWYCLQDFAAAADESCAVVWTAVESPLMTLGDLNRDTFKSPLPIENGHMYGYVFNNYWFTNYKASQGGEMVFRFALTSMKKYDPAAASRFGQSARISLPAVVCVASSGAAGSAPGSFCSASPSNVMVQAVKQAESGQGIIVRLREVSGSKVEAQLKLGPRGFKEAWSCNLVEDPQSKLRISSGKVSVPMQANGLATVLLK